MPRPFPGIPFDDTWSRSSQAAVKDDERDITTQSPSRSATAGVRWTMCSTVVRQGNGSHRRDDPRSNNNINYVIPIDSIRCSPYRLPLDDEGAHLGSLILRVRSSRLQPGTTHVSLLVSCCAAFDTRSPSRPTICPASPERSTRVHSP